MTLTVAAGPAGKVRLVLIETQSLFAEALCRVFAGDAHVQIHGSFRFLREPQTCAEDVDVVMLDIDDYCNDVEDALAACRARFPGAKIAALSSFANVELMQRCLAAQANGYVVKDSSISELSSAIRTIASGKSYVDPQMAGALLCRRAAATVETIDELSPREVAIVRLIAQGLSNREIGDRLLLSEKTIKNQISRIFDKLHITARTQAAVYAIRMGIA